MWGEIKKFIKDQLTEDDNNSVYCPVRCFGVGGSASFVAFQGWHTFTTHVFDAIQFGTGYAAVIAAMAAGIGVKQKLGA